MKIRNRTPERTRACQICGKRGPKSVWCEAYEGGVFPPICPDCAKNPKRMIVGGRWILIGEHS